MKKMKGVVSYATVYEDPRAMFKYQSLLQDYEELYKETEAKKKKLEMMRKRKLTLLDEVRFLRRRYRYLTRSQSQNLPAGQKFVHREPLEAGGKNIIKGRNYTGSKAALRCPAPRPDSTGKRKVNKVVVKLQSSTPVFDVNLKQKALVFKEAELRNSADILDLNRDNRIYSGKEATTRNNPPILDLNQISREEEEELQANSEIMRTQESQISLMRDVNDEQHNDMKLSACRNIGNGSSQAGKRKISWQDPVALRV